MNANLERLVDGAVGTHITVATTRDFKREVRLLISEAYRMGYKDAEENTALRQKIATATASQDAKENAKAPENTPTSVLNPERTSHANAPTTPPAARSPPADRPPSSGIAQTAQKATTSAGQIEAERQRVAKATATL